MFICILFVTSIWAALYNFISGLAKPFRLEEEELKLPEEAMQVTFLKE